MNQGRWRSRLYELLRHPGFRRNPPLVLTRLVAWLVHCGLNLPATARFSQFDFRLYLPARWRGGGSTSAWLFREWYEPELRALPRVLQPGMVFVDAGASTGAFTFAAARIVGGQGRVVAFEPGRRCFLALCRSAELNRFPQVLVRPEALADRNAAACLYHHHGRDNCFALGADPNSAADAEPVSTIRLDTALQQLGLRHVDFLKLDVEGAQELALRGCGLLLETSYPYVLIENHQQACARLGLHPLGAFRLLADRGYRFLHVGPTGHWIPVLNLEMARTVLAVPRQRPEPETACRPWPPADAGERTHRKQDAHDAEGGGR